MRHWRKEKQCNPLKRIRDFFHTFFMGALTDPQIPKRSLAGGRALPARGQQGRHAGLLPSYAHSTGGLRASPYHSTSTKRCDQILCASKPNHTSTSRQGHLPLEHISLSTSEWSKALEEGRAVLQLLRAPLGASSHLPAQPSSPGPLALPQQIQQPSCKMSSWLTWPSVSVPECPLINLFTSQFLHSTKHPHNSMDSLSQGFELIQWAWPQGISTAYFVQRRYLINVCWADFWTKRTCHLVTNIQECIH